jgi:hypothetical protein
LAGNRSFTDYVAERFENELFDAIQSYTADNYVSLDLQLYKIRNIGGIELSEIKVKTVSINDMSDMKIEFDVAVEAELEVRESDYHYDETENCPQWFMLKCSGDLDCNLDDFIISSITEYSSKNKQPKPMSDSLVPIIYKEQLETVAKDFLRRHYPEVLITPMAVEPQVLVEKMGLTIEMREITKDFSVFGQIYFHGCDAEFYDKVSDKMVQTQVDARTIIVDPKAYFLRNLGSVNNTIVHECVHWDLHRKAFELERLYNSNATQIKCQVVGGIKDNERDATGWMEWQANALTPKIQMPAEPFKAKAKQYIARFMRETNASHTIEVMEQVITALETAFGVSRQATKIRLVELGFDEAIGTYTYLDGHYIKPHGFRKGSIKLNQTFSLSAQDAAIERFINLELRALTDSGDYLFIDNHYVYNAPLYVQPGENGKLDLTDYARSHMDECGLVFDMTVTSKVAYQYHTECFLNREPSDITFEIKYHNGYQNAPQERQVAMRKKQQEEALEIRRQMTDDPEQCMELLLKWRNMNYTDLGFEIDRDPKTISRTVKGETTPKVETAALICFGLSLPPVISEKLMAVLQCPLKPMNPNHQWINEALHIKYPEPLWAVKEYLAQYGVEI